MRRYLLVALFLFAVPLGATANVQFGKFFVDKTMRVDYFHTGTKGEELYSLDQVYEQGVWAGSKINLIDTLNLGKYLAKVYDTNTNRLIYSRGFSSVFGEWETTDEAAQGVYRTFHETVLVPMPRHMVQLVIATRDKYNYFGDVFATIINPNSRFVNREEPATRFEVRDIYINGPVASKVDLLLMGDGYTEKEIGKFHKDVKRFLKTLFEAPPFSRRKENFNVRVIDVISQDSGIDQPRRNEWRNTPLHTSYNAFDTQRYVLTFGNKAVRDIAALAPYDQIYIVFNSEDYGGGGIFNLYSTCYAGTDKEGQEWWADYVFVHEFGHAFAGLGDEYYTSDVAYQDFYTAGAEPWEPNVTALHDPEHPKWGHLIETETPVPTPWGKTTYDSIEVARRSLDRTAPEYADRAEDMKQEREELIRSQEYFGKVGCFEGSGYASQGLYRPYLDCRMFSKSLVDFCPVCQEAISKMIDFYTR